MITVVPEIKKEPIQGLEFVFIACDGIWDCLSSQEAVDFVHGQIPSVKGNQVSDVIATMFDRIIATDVASSGGIGCDNMTAILIQLKQ